jgi:hypothetical protein
MIWNGNGTASLELAEDGGRVAVIYRTLRDKGFVVKAPTVGLAVAALADVVNEESMWLLDDSNNADELRAKKRNDIDIAAYNLPLDAGEVFDDEETVERYDDWSG